MVKNQHYVPQFYLRNFSCFENGKEIGLFNINSQKYVVAGPLKNQASGRFFYGKDGKIEDWLSNIEGFLATCIRSILETRSIPLRNSYDHVDLVAFVALTDLRNPVSIDSITQRNDAMKSNLLELDPNVELSKFVTDSTHEENVEVALSNVKLVIKVCGDLQYKLLINNTSTALITSDVPVVRYNQFLERKKWEHGKTGFGNIGLQIFIPLNPDVLILFYDPGIYDLGAKKQDYLILSDDNDIDQLNLLQMLNCNRNVFFNDEISKEYITELYETSKKYTKANKLIFNTYDHYHGKEGSRLLAMGSTDCEIDLRIKGLRVNSGATKIKFNESVLMLRRHAQQVRETEGYSL